MLNKEDYKNLFKKDKYGYILKICEEFGELLQAATHYFDKKATEDDLIEEIADVKIQLEKLEIFVNPKKLEEMIKKKKKHLKNIIYEETKSL